MTNSGSFFFSKSDTTWFSKSESNERTNFSKLKLENGEILFISFNKDATICFIQETLESPSFMSYLDLPYDELSIDWGMHADPEIVKTRAQSDEYIHSSVIINKQPAKDQKKLTKQDWKKAEKRRKEPISFLEIVDTKSRTLYASASRISNTDGETQYSVKLSKQCPEKSRIFFKSALFMILWIYQQPK